MHKLIAATLFLVACGSTPAPTTTTTPDPAGPTNPAEPAPRPGGDAEIGEWGFDTKGMNTKVAPGASFYEYANGAWLASTKIPDDKSNYGMFTALQDRSEERTKEIILGVKVADGPEAQKIADYYASFMDEAAIEAKGLEPIKAELAKIAGIKDAKALIAQLAENVRDGRKSPFGVYVAQDDKEPTKHIAHLYQSGLGLPDRDMYDAKGKPQFEKLREGYKQYIATMLGFAGITDAKRAAAVYALEEKLAEVHWTRTESRNPDKTYNKLATAELTKQAPGFDWKAWLAGVGLGGESHVNVRQPTAFTGMAKLVKSQPIAVWRDYLTLHLLSASAPYLAKQYVDAHFQMFGKTLSDTPQLEERWKRGVGGVTGALGEAVGKLYVAKHFTPATKAHAEKLVKNLFVAMGQRLDNLAWMSPATKAKAKEKLAAFNTKIGYPSKWRDYSALEVVAGDPVGNARRAVRFEYERRLAKLGKPVDREEWSMTPMTVNAYYSSSLNEIVFPAAILQPPFFDPNADDAINYGGIGAVIGHEISHGFDDRGSKYDGTGTLANWWTDEDRDKFKTATAKLVAQYDAYCPVPAANGKPAVCVKGELTLGENIADLAGLTVAYQAYKLSLGGKPAPVIDGMTGDQRFFLGWAQVWRRLYRDAELVQRLTTDSHSPSEYRTSVVRNLDAWYEAFKPASGDKLYLAPEERVRIW